MTTGGTRVPPEGNRNRAPHSREAAVERGVGCSDTSSVGWRDADWADEDSHVVTTTDHSRALVWGALAVALLAVGGLVYSLLS